MNVILVGLTLLVLAGVLISCVALGSDRFAAAQRASRDGIEVLPPARGPLEGLGPETGKGVDPDAADVPGSHLPGRGEAGHRGSARGQTREAGTGTAAPDRPDRGEPRADEVGIPGEGAGA